MCKQKMFYYCCACKVLHFLFLKARKVWKNGKFSSEGRSISYKENKSFPCLLMSANLKQKRFLFYCFNKIFLINKRILLEVFIIPWSLEDMPWGLEGYFSRFWMSSDKNSRASSKGKNNIEDKLLSFKLPKMNKLPKKSLEGKNFGGFNSEEFFSRFIF